MVQRHKIGVISGCCAPMLLSCCQNSAALLFGRKTSTGHILFQQIKKIHVQLSALVNTLVLWCSPNMLHCISAFLKHFNLCILPSASFTPHLNLCFKAAMYSLKLSSYCQSGFSTWIKRSKCSQGWHGFSCLSPLKDWWFRFQGEDRG